jgi:hypothetical protein
VSVFESVAWAVDGNHLAVVEDAVKDCGGEHVVAEYLAPFTEALV